MAKKANLIKETETVKTTKTSAKKAKVADAKVNEEKVETVTKEPVKTTKKATTKKATAKKTVKAEAKVEAKTVKSEETPVEEKVEAKAEAKPAKKTTAKKATTKKAAAKKPVKAEAKVEAKAVKSEEAPVEEKVEAKPAKKTTAKKATTKTTTKKATKAEGKEEVKPAKKATSKKEVASVDYDAMDLGSCIEMMRNAGVGYGYEDYCRLLLDEADWKVLEKNIVEGNGLANKDGFDTNVVMATLTKVAATMDLTASEFAAIKNAMDACVKVTLSETADENSKNYYDEFKVAEKVLMVAQRKNMTNSEAVSALLNSDVKKFFEHFKMMAYAVLKEWRYQDVEFYQEFVFAFLSQYTDLFAPYQNDVQMDCADLYILHGDEARGDYEYSYILRENLIKDYIYYRFANVYVERNLEKAKAIAYRAFSCVDDRYDYHKNLVEIVQK